MTLSQKAAGTGFLALLTTVISQPGLKDCGLDQLLSSGIPTAVGSLSASVAANLFSDYTKELIDNGNKAIVWPSEAILNHHVRKLVSTAIAGIIDHKSSECIPEDHLDLTAFCLRMDKAWEMTAGLSSPEAVTLAEAQLPQLLTGGLEDMVNRKPLTEEEWTTLLKSLIMLSNDGKDLQIAVSEGTLKKLASELETNFVAGLFSALCHASPDSESAYKKIQILKLNEIQDQLASRFESFQEEFKSQLQNHASELARIREQLTLIETQLTLQSTPPSKQFSSKRQTEGISAFWFHSEWTTFQGRSDEYRALKSFLNGEEGADPEFRWAVVLGQAGSGKSRISLQLGKDSEALLVAGKPGGWQMLYLESSRDSERFARWEEWMPAFPTLIIIDYAASRRENVWQIIKVLTRRANALGPSKLPKPVRVLLLERSAAKALLEVGHEDLCREPESALVTKAHFRFAGDVELQGRLRPLYLSALDNFTLSRLLYQTYEERQGKGMNRHPLVYIDRLNEIPSDSRPLFAMLLGTRLAEDLNAADLRPRELAEELLKEENARWKKYSLDHPELNEKMLHLLTLACVCDGVEAEKAISTGLSYLPGNEPIEALARVVFSWGGGYEDSQFSSLQPDFLRELYVLLRLTKGALCLSEGEAAVKRDTKHLLEVIYEKKLFEPDVSFYFNALQNFPELAQNESFVKFSGMPQAPINIPTSLKSLSAKDETAQAPEVVNSFNSMSDSSFRSAVD